MGTFWIAKSISRKFQKHGEEKKLKSEKFFLWSRETTDNFAIPFECMVVFAFARNFFLISFHVFENS